MRNSESAERTRLPMAVESVINSVVQPLLRTHGGGCRILSVDEGVVELEFADACTGCRLRPLTLMGAIRPRLLAIDGVVDVKARGVGVSKAVADRFDRLAQGSVRPRSEEGE